MSSSIPVKILDLKGQKVNKITYTPENHEVVICCDRDKRRKARDPISGQKATINRYVRRRVRDVPFMGYRCIIEVELAQVTTRQNGRRIEACEFVEKGARWTHRFARLISGLCRHMSILAVSRHLGIRWETVKNIDKHYLLEHLPGMDPEQLSDLKYLGVDEVARSRGHDYMTVIYDMVGGHLVGVEAGRTAEVFSSFLKRLPRKTTENIAAVAMDMGPAYQKSVREYLPNTDIVFDRFHVMQNYSKALSNQRRIEFRKADWKSKTLIKGTHYLLLKNADKLSEEQEGRLSQLLLVNTNFNLMYMLKEQLQWFWETESFEEMQESLSSWCDIADRSGMLYIKKFADFLRRHATGICNYAKHRLTSARIEAGNVSIGLIRKRARGVRDTEYFKLKIRQTSIPDNISMFCY
jgi:transposase